ncbi:uncharacterized protein LOC122279800 [Carya illinoinensis]|uniref:Cotton fiber protein n=1 Tax=Carya illinoinensis TaxID=32201 RepID=A0A8T1P467_CARIL|nr:uncharacterized protein LOC122279800 [Carya illinoinensis]KAG6639316.1 hypothetical protein CIPAW_10G090600 [Carya illinoinensis]
MSKYPPTPMICKLSSKEYPQKAKGISFFAFLLSIFVYISVFYTFNISPSTVFNTTKFWFFISNTLILIIAADYGTFSNSSREKHDLYEDYNMMVMHSQVKNNVSSFVSRYPDHVVKGSTTDPKQEDVDDLQEKKEILAEDQRDQHLYPESKSIMANISTHDSKKPRNHENLQEKKEVLTRQADHEIYATKPAKDKLIVLIHDESKNMSENDDQKHDEPSDEDSEFSTMSDEELNRRVEEFIKSFNRQIRLQSYIQEK